MFAKEELVLEVQSNLYEVSKVFEIRLDHWRTMLGI